MHYVYNSKGEWRFSLGHTLYFWILDCIYWIFNMPIKVNSKLIKFRDSCKQKEA